MKSFVRFAFAVVLISFTVMSLPASASKRAGGRKPSQAAPEPMSVTVSIGDRTTVFTISQRTDAGSKPWNLAEAVNGRPRRSTMLSREDMIYIQSRVTALGSATNELRFCTRNSITILQGRRQTIGCIGSRNKTATEIEQIVNLLTELF